MSQSSLGTAKILSFVNIGASLLFGGAFGSPHRQLYERANHGVEITRTAGQGLPAGSDGKWSPTTTAQNAGPTADMQYASYVPSCSIVSTSICNCNDGSPQRTMTAGASCVASIMNAIPGCDTKASATAVAQKPTTMETLGKAHLQEGDKPSGVSCTMSTSPSGTVAEPTTTSTLTRTSTTTVYKPAGPTPAVMDSPQIENPTMNNPTGDNPTKDPSTGKTPVGENSAEGATMGGAPAQKATTGKIPAEDAATGETLSQEATSGETPAEEASTGETPAEEASTGETQAEGAATGETAAVPPVVDSSATGPKIAKRATTENPAMCSIVSIRGFAEGPLMMGCGCKHGISDADPTTVHVMQPTEPIACNAELAAAAPLCVVKGSQSQGLISCDCDRWLEEQAGSQADSQAGANPCKGYQRG